MNPASLELHIEELVLQGFAASDRYHVGEAVQRELARLFTEQGTPPSLGHGREVARVDGGAIGVKPGSSAEAIGAQVAQAVYDRLGSRRIFYDRRDENGK